jgi:hypothetical protein
MSVVGFMAYYAHYIDFPSRIATDDRQPPMILQAGYSYGAMVTTKLPPLDTILAPFHSPAIHTPAADIRLRAQHLAEQQSKLFATPISPRKSLGMRVGGDEDISRKSHDHFRRPHHIDQEERILRGVKDILARTKIVRKKRRHKPHEDAEEVVHVEECMTTVENLVPFRSAYLAVSPPIGIATNLATMTFPNPFIGFAKKFKWAGNQASSPDGTAAAEHEAELKLARNPTLVVCGDQDGFLTLRKFREWTSKLKGYDGSLFRVTVVAGAGHFWAEEDVMSELRDALGEFGTKLLGKGAQLLQPWYGR